ncbi:hypothetical protein [uncultured Roseobacter sp.]|uniref:hypothetical protein n=1 Tax=uncultured Roseobacter sp. TaxID=114847 RepID=UPI00262D14EE|nr:hypothetical protein [uncultured Roseobacter sp.]
MSPDPSLFENPIEALVPKVLQEQNWKLENIGDVLDFSVTEAGEFVIVGMHGVAGFSNGNLLEMSHPGSQFSKLLAIPVRTETGELVVLFREGVLRLKKGQITSLHQFEDPIVGDELEFELQISSDGTVLFYSDRLFVEVEEDSAKVAKWDFAGQEISSDPIFEDVSSPFLFRSDVGLIEVKNGQIVLAESDTGKTVGNLRSWSGSGDLMTSAQGVFHLSGDNIREFRPDSEGNLGRFVREVQIHGGEDLFEFSTGYYWLRNGVFYLVDHSLPREMAHRNTFDNADGTWTIVRNTKIETFDLKSGEAVEVTGSGDLNDIESIAAIRDSEWVNGFGWIFLTWDGEPFFIKDGHIAFISTEDKNLSRLLVTDEVIGPYWSHIRTDLGPHVLSSVGIPVVKSSSFSHSQPPESGIKVEWILRDLCGPAFPFEERMRIVSDGVILPTQVNRLGLSHPHGTGDFLVSSFIDASSYGVGEVSVGLQYLGSTTGSDWATLPGSLITASIGTDLGEYMLAQAKKLLPVLVIGHALLFGVLVLRSRHHTRSWEILTDPVWGKLGVWFWLSIKYVPALQRWMLERWFMEVSSRTKVQPYLPIPMEIRRTGEKAKSDEVIFAFGPGARIWIHGGPGMGKTSALDNLRTQYFGGKEYSSLRSAYRQYGFQILFIRLRDFRNVPIPTAPEEWLFEISARTFDSLNCRFYDEKLLKSVILSGNFILALDGANEVDDGGAIEQFSLRYPQVGLLVTSQTIPFGRSNDVFEEWSLPDSMEEYATEFFELFLSPSVAKETLSNILSSGVAAELKSGHDLKVISDLIEAGTLPKNLPASRGQLYLCLLLRLRSLDGGEYDLEGLSHTAWEAFRLGRRDLSSDGEKEYNLLQPLVGQSNSLVRTLDGERYEFRHDQMRAFLAARWLVEYEVNPIGLLEKEEDVWRVPRSEQRMVWDFFAELTTANVGQEALEWATLHADRAELQVALRKVLNSGKWGY